MGIIRKKSDVLSALSQCAYSYSFYGVHGLEHDSKCDTGLENYAGRDVRKIVFESLVKEFAIELRHKIYNEDKEHLIQTNLEDLIKLK